MAKAGRFRSKMRGNDMTLKRMDNVGIVVESLDAAISFFAELGLKLEGRATIEGEWAGRVTGLGPQRVEIAMMVTPDGHSRLEISRFLTPPVVADHRNAPVNALGYPQTQWSPERPLPPPVSLASQSHHEKPAEVTCTSRGNLRVLRLRAARIGGSRR